jgi:hypothetical protein
MSSYNEREGVNEAFLEEAVAAGAEGNEIWQAKPRRKNLAAPVSAHDASVPAPAVEKAKKALSPEHKAKMLTAAAAPPSAPAAAEEEKPEKFVRKSISGKKFLWNPDNNYVYYTKEDGSKGIWAGIYNHKMQKINFSAAEPESRKGGSRKQKSTRKRSRKSRKMYR